MLTTLIRGIIASSGLIIKEKMKKISVVLVFMLFFMSSMFAEEWYRCKVVSVGPSEAGVILVKLTAIYPSGFSDRWFIAEPSVQKEMLAVALAAFLSGASVSVRIVSTDQYSKIERMYILSDS